MRKFTFDGQPRLKLLTDSQIELIHAKAMHILENTGVRFGSDEALQILQKKGAMVDLATSIAKIPPHMVIDAISQAPAEIQLYDREGNPAVLLGGNKAHFDPGSAPMNFMESDGVTVRIAEAKDLVNISKVNDALENIAMQSTSVVLDDVPECIGDSYRLYLLLKNSPKPIISGAFSVEGISHMREMLAAVAGGYETLREKPVVVFDICPSPPMKWSHISSQNIIDCARFGLPLETISVPMPGAVAPATLSGSVLLHTVETLSGLVLAQCVNPGAPVVYGGAPMYFDMRHSTTSLNSIESNMISTAYAQMGKYYGLPTHTYSGLSDSKLIDVQAGLDSGISAMVASMSGVNVISGAGVIEFCNTFSLEKLAIDNDICGMALRYVRGMDFSEEALAADLISQLGPGGDYLSTEHTFRWFRKEAYIPSPVIDRRSRVSWSEQGSKGAFTLAQEKVRDILQNHHPRALDQDKELELDRVTKKVAHSLGISELPFLPK